MSAAAPIQSAESQEPYAIPDVARTYGSYCRTMLEHYQAAFVQFRLANLPLTGEILRVRSVPVRSMPSSKQEQLARSYSATRGSFS